MAHENTVPATGSYASNHVRQSKSPPSDGGRSIPDDQWSIVHTSTRLAALQRHHAHSGHAGVQQQGETPTPRPRNDSLRSELALTPQPHLVPAHFLLDRFRRPPEQGMAQPTHTRPGHWISRMHQQYTNSRNYTAPLRVPRIPGSVHPNASRSPSGPEQRSPERPFYRPMSGVSPPAQAPPGRLQQPPSNVATHGPPGGLYTPVSGNSNLRGDFVSTNDATYNHITRALERMSLGFSPAYNGDPRLERNRSADVPNELNCSLFLVNLPPDLTTHRLITAIHAMGPTGRIYATHINGPEPDRQHPGCAAKVIFFERKAAHGFFALCEDRGFVVDGFSARVMWNRIKTAQQAHSRTTTRVLLIGGDRQFVNPNALTEYFRTKLQFQIDCIIPHGDGLDGRNAVVEYRFGSFRCQAEAAKMALVREHQDVKCFFHPDPCDPSHPDWAQGGFRWPGTRLPRPHPAAGLQPVPEDQETWETDSFHNVADRLRFQGFLR
ncbi:hypothetical protein VMCG_04967 [Cytospora schulzeri]|uniref:RRM domain-containing protein n=1 Tax=Cytospora schulzeri TaxID=448051 RepID=A0A423WMR6_9PEZI|nr:hypothetical protein VMCG_04967 [Valsa malicola]